MAPPRARDNPWTRSKAGVLGATFLAMMLLACLGSLPHTAGTDSTSGSVRYDQQDKLARQIPPALVAPPMNAATDDTAVDTPGKRLREAALAAAQRATAPNPPTEADILSHRPRYLLGTDVLGRSLLIRCLTGGGVSLGIGLCAAMLSVFLGTLYGSLSGYIGGRTDAVMMRIVDILYGLPSILLVVLLAVAVDAALLRWQIARGTELSPALKQGISLLTMLVAIGGVSWLTMARVIRGQVLSLKAQPFMEAARAIGVPVRRQFLRHLLPNLVGPITVYATLTVPQAILQESFLSFLGIGVRPPLPSWGNLAAEGLSELNPYASRWWLLLFPCILLGSTLLALNFVGEGLREALDPKRAR